MAVKSILAAVVVTGTEQNTVAAVTPFEDATGMINTCLVELDMLITKLTYLNGNMPSGTNKTNIATLITNLSA